MSTIMLKQCRLPEATSPSEFKKKGKIYSNNTLLFVLFSKWTTTGENKTNNRQRLGSEKKILDEKGEKLCC